MKTADFGETHARSLLGNL